MSDQSTDPKQIEILAFMLSREPVTGDEAAQKIWQEDAAFRNRARARAEEIVEQLHRLGGLRLRVSDSRRQDGCLSWLMTIPPRPAYDAKELAALNQV